MLKDVNLNLDRTIEQKRRKQELQLDLHAIRSELQDKTEKLEALSVRVEKERLDIDQLKGSNLTSFFYLILGKREERLEKGRQKLSSAENAYQQNAHQVELLEQEQSNLIKQIIQLKDVETEYERLISEKEALLCQPNQTVSNELLELSQQIADLDEETGEITDVINDGNSIITDLESIIKAIEIAQKHDHHWSDIFKTGIGATTFETQSITSRKKLTASHRL